MKKILSLAFEEDSSGQTKVEKEKVFYACISSKEILNKAQRIEFHEQYQIKIPKSDSNKIGGRIRVRSTSVGSGQTEYVLTTKIKGEEGEHETSVLVTADVFNQFKLLSTEGMVKTRYFYDIPGRKEKWEVDVFLLPNGKTSNWCKIDFEFIDLENTTIPPLPEGFTGVIPGDTVEAADKAFIWKLYEEVFLASAK